MPPGRSSTPQALARADTRNSPRPVIDSSSRTSSDPATSPRFAIARAGSAPRSTTATRTAVSSALSSTSKYVLPLCSVALVASSVADSVTSSTRSTRPQATSASSTKRLTAGTLEGRATMRTRVGGGHAACPPVMSQPGLCAMARTSCCLSGASARSVERDGPSATSVKMVP